MKRPLVSVVMAVYNAQEFLNIAIDSILLQTYKNLELVVVDDGSTDNSVHIIKNYSDRRLKYIYQKNQGLAAALNTGIRAAMGKYIARMDADDISDSSRLEKQVKFLEKNKDVGLVGTSFYMIDENGGVIDHSYNLDRPQDLRAEIFVRNPFGHGTVMLRRRAIDSIGFYNTVEPIEDYEMWWRVTQKFKTANLPEDLYSWRIVASGMSHGSSDKRQPFITSLMKKIWQQTKLPSMSLSQIKEGLTHYQSEGTAYHEQYLYMLAALYLSAVKMNRRLYASKLLVKLLLADKSFREAITELRRNPRSHN